MKIVTVVGARPQFIKAAALSHVLRSRDDLQEVIIHTGQHFDPGMSAVFFDQLGIPAPDVSLDIHSLPHGAMTGRMTEGIEQYLLSDGADLVLVYGDTNSTLAGALAAAKLHIPVAHVEAGLRSFNRRMPEELNRVVTDHLSDLLFAPTPAAVENLAAEGISGEQVVLTGDVMFDCAIRFGDVARRESDVLNRFEVVEGGYVLCTVHRAENTGDKQAMAALIDALQKVAATIPVVMPMHPRTAKLMQQDGLNFAGINGLKLVEPVGYLDMVRLEQGSALILTDSGGVQKEAYFHRVPCITLRTETEWVELVDAGWNEICPLHLGGQVIADRVGERTGSSGKDISLYGDGRAAERIANALLQTGPGAG